VAVLEIFDGCCGFVEAFEAGEKHALVVGVDFVIAQVALPGAVAGVFTAAPAFDVEAIDV